MPAARTRSRLAVFLTLVMLGALVVRLAFVFGVARHDDHFYDAAYYELQAGVLAQGKGFVDPFELLPGHSGKYVLAADHPPVTASVLGGVAWVRDRLDLGPDRRLIAMRIATMLAGLSTVFLLGLLGRVVAGGRAGLLAAGLGALYLARGRRGTLSASSK